MWNANDKRLKNSRVGRRLTLKIFCSWIPAFAGMTEKDAGVTEKSMEAALRKYRNSLVM